MQHAVIRYPGLIMQVKLSIAQQLVKTHWYQKQWLLIFLLSCSRYLGSLAFSQEQIYWKILLLCFLLPDFSHLLLILPHSSVRMSRNFNNTYLDSMLHLAVYIVRPSDLEITFMTLSTSYYGSFDLVLSLNGYCYN